jgi:hypothetical protein
MGIPSSTGGYPKMVTVAGPTGGLLPGVYPSGHAKQFNYVILNSAADETAYTGNAVAPFSTIASGINVSWENRHHT